MTGERTERETLNILIETCHDGERGFRYAANHLSDPDVKALFLEVSAQRAQFGEALLRHAQRLGGATERSGSVSAALHRGWMTLKDAVQHDEAVIIREAERGERATLAAYEDALGGMLPPASRETIETQCAAVRHTYGHIDKFLKRQPPAE